MSPSDRDEPGQDRAGAAPNAPTSGSQRPETGLEAALTTFRLPHYGALWSSNLVQFICFHVLFLAMQWLVTSLTELRTAVGFLSFIQGGTIALFSPLAGVVVDRQPKRSLIILGRLGLAGVATTTGALAYAGVIVYWHLLVIAVVGGVLAAVLNPATQTYVVDVVGRRRTDHAISLNAIGSSVGTIGGAALAGMSLLLAAVQTVNHKINVRWQNAHFLLSSCLEKATGTAGIITGTYLLRRVLKVTHPY